MIELEIDCPPDPFCLRPSLLVLLACTQKKLHTVKREKIPQPDRLANCTNCLFVLPLSSSLSLSSFFPSSLTSRLRPGASICQAPQVPFCFSLFFGLSFFLSLFPVFSLPSLTFSLSALSLVTLGCLWLCSPKDSLRVFPPSLLSVSSFLLSSISSSFHLKRSSVGRLSRRSARSLPCQLL